jgi:hypothetical protein
VLCPEDLGGEVRRGGTGDDGLQNDETLLLVLQAQKREQLVEEDFLEFELVRETQHVVVAGMHSEK